MKVLALIESPHHVCYRYRIEPFAWALADRGLELEVASLACSVPARVAQLLRARRASVVILQRKLLPLWQLWLLRRRASRLIYDVDDALFQRDSYSRKDPESWMRLIRFWATIQAADAVSVGNGFLQERTASYIESDRVHVMPTCVDPSLYGLASHRRRGSRARLVWIGQRSTLPSLDRAQAHLAAAATARPGLSLRIICDRAPRLSGIRIKPRRWSIATESAELAEGDIGINWLPDDQWSRGKCGLKVLQYMAAGLPVVANPVGMNREMVAHGRTGFLASTPAEWARAIGRLADDPALRRRMGEAGRRRVERQFSVDRWAPRFAQLVEQVARGESTRKPKPMVASRTVDEHFPRKAVRASRASLETLVGVEGNDQ